MCTIGSVTHAHGQCQRGRENLAEILSQVSGGEVVMVTRRGQEIARIVPPMHAGRQLPNRPSIRGAMLKHGARVTAGTVVVQRNDERA